MPDVGGSGVSVAPRNPGDPSVIDPMAGTSPPPGSTPTLAEVLAEGADADATPIYGGTSPADNDSLELWGGTEANAGSHAANVLVGGNTGSGGGTVQLLGGFADGDPTLAGGDIFVFSGDGGPGKNGGVLSMGAGWGEDASIPGATMQLDGGVPGQGADATLAGGDTTPDEASSGGSVQLLAGGNATRPGAKIILHGGDDTNAGNLTVESGTDGFGASGQALVANGMTSRTDWGGVQVGSVPPTDPPDGFLPIYIDITGPDLYIWTGGSGGAWSGPWVIP